MVINENIGKIRRFIRLIKRISNSTFIIQHDYAMNEEMFKYVCHFLEFHFNAMMTLWKYVYFHTTCVRIQLRLSINRFNSNRLADGFHSSVLFIINVIWMPINMSPLLLILKHFLWTVIFVKCVTLVHAHLCMYKIIPVVSRALPPVLMHSFRCSRRWSPGDQCIYLYRFSH